MHSLLAIALLWIQPASAGVNDCSESTTTEALVGHLDRAEQSFTARDPDGFVAGLEAASLALPCVDTVLTPQIAAHFHRLAGLSAFTAGSKADAAAFLSASRTIDPSASFPADMLPPAHPVLDLYANPEVDAALRRTVPKPSEGDVFFDGSRSRQRPASVPTIFQLTSSEGTVISTALIPPERSLPLYEGVSLKRQASQITAASSGGLLVISAVLYAAARASQSSFDTNDTLTVDELAKLRTRTNGLALSSYGLGALGVAGLGGAIILGRN